MKISIIRKARLDDIASASGVEVVNGIIYILSDDSSFLYKIKHDLTLLEKISLYQTNVENLEHIAKPDKPDLECIGQFSINGFQHLLLLGSGSKSPQRDKGFLVKLPTNYSRKHLVWEVDLSRLYALLRSDERITANGEINIEGLAFSDSKAYLVNRGNVSGIQNVVLSFSKEEFVEYVQGHMDGIPFPAIHSIALPEISGVMTGFTGVDFYDNQFWFTCSAENTSNAYDDGKVEGSMLGKLQVEERNNGRYNEELIKLEAVTSFIDNGNLFTEKVESVSVYELDQKGHYTALAVTDNDGGPSTLLLLDIEL